MDTMAHQDIKLTDHSPISWVPSLYFAEALPYMAVMTLSVIMYTNLGLSNTELALYTSWLYLPWVIKPLWSPIVDRFRTERWWILAMQLLIGASLAAVALSLHTDLWLRLTLAAFWLMAFSSATHDIAADGMYILGLSEKDQALYVGWRSTFYRIGSIFCQGVLVILAGHLESRYNVPLAWSVTIGLLGAIMILLALWHTVALPRPNSEKTKAEAAVKGNILSVFFSKKGVVAAILFMLLFRLPEAQLAKMAQPFMLRSLEEGGLSLSTVSVGYAYGTLGVFGLLLGGIVAGWLVSKHGLRRWWWPMILAISLPDAVYIYLAYMQPSSLAIIDTCVFIEQFGYGFGFAAYSLFLVYFSRGEFSTAIFSICTAFQALGMMLPGMVAGYLADTLGWVNFFIWVCACCLVTFLVSMLVKLPDDVD